MKYINLWGRRGSNPATDVQSVYSTAPTDWARRDISLKVNLSKIWPIIIIFTFSGSNVVVHNVITFGADIGVGTGIGVQNVESHLVP